ncbi:MAG TPA: DUF5829 family protein [Blastocatellia bacterium]|nr:DUF5829 family protein [Blastocatellia bacterium]
MVRTMVAGAMTLLLGSLGLGKMTATLPSPIPLNHCLIVLDSATYKAIEQDSFLRREFAITEQRTTTRTDISYTGLYFYGANTYFEFFDAANQSIGRLGDSAIAFGVDKVGMLEPINTELASEFSVGQVITRGFSGKQVPWFYMALPKSFPPDSGFRIWIMEYHPRFLSEWNPQSDSKGPGVSRRQVLQRYTSVLKDTPPKPYLHDVVALTVAVNEQTKSSLIDLGKLLGYRPHLVGTTTVLQGPDVELRLIHQTSQARGIQEIRMSVNRRPDKQSEFRFGARSVLRFETDGLATWSF